MNRPQTGVVSLACDFVAYLRRPSVRDRIGPLQLGGRLEDYLVKEFMQFVYWRSKGSRFCEGNRGQRGEQRIDIAFVRSSPKREPTIEAFIEAKYLQNRSFLADSDNKSDEIRSTLKDLARQLSYNPSKNHSGFGVGLRARTVKVYGLVFASYVRRANEPDKNKAFFERVVDVAADEGLQYHDLPKPYLLHAYDGHRLMLSGEEWRVWLRSGLWRPRTAHAPAS